MTHSGNCRPFLDCKQLTANQHHLVSQQADDQDQVGVGVLFTSRPWVIIILPIITKLFRALLAHTDTSRATKNVWRRSSGGLLSDVGRLGSVGGLLGDGGLLSAASVANHPSTAQDANYEDANSKESIYIRNGQVITQMLTFRS